MKRENIDTEFRKMDQFRFSMFKIFHLWEGDTPSVTLSPQSVESFANMTQNLGISIFSRLTTLHTHTLYIYVCVCVCVTPALQRETSWSYVKS